MYSKTNLRIQQKLLHTESFSKCFPRECCRKQIYIMCAVYKGVATNISRSQTWFDLHLFNNLSPFLKTEFSNEIYLKRGDNYMRGARQAQSLGLWWMWARQKKIAMVFFICHANYVVLSSVDIENLEGYGLLNITFFSLCSKMFLWILNWCKIIKIWLIV